MFLLLFFARFFDTDDTKDHPAVHEQFSLVVGSHSGSSREAIPTGHFGSTFTVYHWMVMVGAKLTQSWMNPTISVS